MAEFRDIENKVLALRSNLESKQSLNETLLSEIKTLEEDVAREENKIAAVKSKIEIFDDSIRRYEGFNRGVKNLLGKLEEDRSSFSGVLGVLADIIKVERGYEEAVNAFLGDDVQIVITENDDDIRKIIEYLKANNMGRAAFISLETLRKLKKEMDLQI